MPFLIWYSLMMAKKKHTEAIEKVIEKISKVASGGMDFSKAIKLATDGKKVARTVWKDSAMNGRHLVIIEEPSGVDAKSMVGKCYSRNAKGSDTLPYEPLNEDFLADDWKEVVIKKAGKSPKK